MKELIFNIGQIFNIDSQDDCLVQYGCTRYHIPAYQRGYKWASDKGGAVSILLSDLWNNFQFFQQAIKKEYYLQYITVKRTEVQIDGNATFCLEVIDGQQRLTTLSIIISVLAALSQNDNVSVDRLHYAIRENFFSNHIYQEDDLLELVSKEWKEYQNTPLDKQDIFYLYSASKASFDFFSLKKDELDDFYEYLTNNVKLIVNSVESHVQSETVFKNLNSNKVPLTEVELIKGLLITKVGRGSVVKSPKHYKEVLAERSGLGRKWDEISRWANQPEIRSFYFNQGDGMHQLLLLTAMLLETRENKLEKQINDKDFPLFNFYNQYSDTQKLFKNSLQICASLKDWFQDNEKYNLLGFCRFVKGSSSNSLSFLKTCLEYKTKPELIGFLNKTKDGFITRLNITTLRYSEHVNEIHAILLSLNVFNDSLESRFNFHEFIDKQWSLEHIFPQSPEGKKAILNDEQKRAVKNMLGTGLTSEIDAILDKAERDELDKLKYYSALQNLSDLNSIGNMCLLTSSDNSSNGCSFFKEKRANVLDLLRKGSFVPAHTFDVFSKMIPTLESNDLETWSAEDIKKHTEYIAETLTPKLSAI